MRDIRIEAHMANEVINERDCLESRECPLPLSRSADIPILLDKMKEKFPA